MSFVLDIVRDYCLNSPDESCMEVCTLELALFKDCLRHVRSPGCPAGRTTKSSK